MALLDTYNYIRDYVIEYVHKHKKTIVPFPCDIEKIPKIILSQDEIENLINSKHYSDIRFNDKQQLKQIINDPDINLTKEQQIIKMIAVCICAYLAIRELAIEYVQIYNTSRNYRQLGILAKRMNDIININL